MLRKFKRAAIALLMLSGVGMTAAAVTASPALARPVVIVCNLGNPVLCDNRAGGGTSYGTHVIGWDNPNDNNNNFIVHWLEHMCDTGTASGYVTQTCPFTVGSGLNGRYDGAAIVQVAAYGGGAANKCVGTDGAGGALLTVCNNLDGTGGGNGTIMVLPQIHDMGNYSGQKSYFVNRYWSNYNYAHGQYNAPAWKCAYRNGDQVILDRSTGDAGYCEWTEM